MIPTTEWRSDFKLGIAQSDDRGSCYLSAPTWDCGWYWSFGYLGHKHVHFHLDSLKDRHNTDLCSAIKKEFGDTLTITDEKDLWTFAELAQTVYTLKETAEVLGRGGSHLTTNPLSSLIKNEDEVKRINEKVLPMIFDEINKIIQKYR